MSPRPTDKPHDLRMAVVRAVESYPETFYSDIDKDAKQEADEKLLRCMKAFLANNGWDRFSHPKDFAKLMFDNTELISVTRLSGSTGKAIFRFPVLGEYSNVYKALAGGAHATAHDYFTGHALLMIAKPGFWLSLGTSLSLNLTFLKPAQVGDILLLEAEIIQATSKLAILRGVLRREKDGVIMSTSEQVRNNIDKPQSRL